MLSYFTAVIFDMDGVLIDSEPLWRRAMIRGFSQVGINLSEDDCRKTMGNRFQEVVAYWLEEYQLKSVNAKQVEHIVMQELFQLIETEGKIIPGIPEILNFCEQHHLKTGLATSSSNDLMNQVLKKLKLTNRINCVISAELMKHGKPHPEVFLTCAEQLKLAPQQCIVIEDSLNGVIAAKAAQMKVIAVPDPELVPNNRFIIADYQFKSMYEVLDLFKTLVANR